MEAKKFIKSMRDIASLGNKSVTVAKTDFERLLVLAENGSKISTAECTCMGDQYGHMTNPKCIIHGSNT